MKHLCIIVPGSRYLFDPWTIEPLGALYLATVAKPYCDEVSVRIWGEEEIPSADWYGITMVTPHYEDVREIMARIRLASDAKIILGGAHCTFLPEETMADLQPDFLVAGEGERALISILNDQYQGLPGIYHGSDGWGKTDATQLGDLPIPDHGLLQHKYYPNPAFANEQGGAIMASRGCPYGCSYCGPSVGLWTRWRDPAQVAEEMALYKQWRFEDDDLFGSLAWFKDFAQLVPPNRSWRCSVRAKSIDMRILELARMTGCKQVGIGVETADPDLLKKHCPSKSVEANTRGVQMVKQAGMLVTAFLIAGLPGETEQSIQNTIRWIEEVRPDKFTVSACTPYPGSKLYSKPERYGVKNLSADWQDYRQLGHEDDDVAFVYDTDQLDRKQMTELWHRLRETAQYGIAPRS